MDIHTPLAAPQRLLGPRRPIPSFDVQHGYGSWLYLADGTRIMDGSSGMLCVNVGHGSAAVAGRIARQLSRVAFAGSAVAVPYPQLELVERLCRMVGRPEDYVAFTTSGTTAVEVAIQLAKNIARRTSGPKKHRILTSNLGYHGNSAYTLALAGNQTRRPKSDDSFGLGPSFSAPYSPAHGGGNDKHVCDATCADLVAASVDSVGADTVAAVIVEPVNGTTGGAFVPPVGYMQRLASICAERGVLLIHDEVLTGLWRTGTPLASDHWTAAGPDICILSKGLGGGYTNVGAVLVSPDRAAALVSEEADPLPALGTGAGTQLQAATCMGVLDELECLDAGDLDIRLTQVANRVGALRTNPKVQAARGIGFLHAIELPTGSLWKFMTAAQTRGAFFYPFGGTGKPRSEGIMIAPPVNTSTRDLDFMFDVIEDSLDAI